MNKIYYLSTCSTCTRIINELGLKNKNFEFQDIKSQQITEHQLAEMKKMAGSYETLFSKVAIKYRSLGLNEMNLTEEDFKNYILQEYTFLKRPVIIVDNKIFIGNSKNTIASIKAIL